MVAPTIGIQSFGAILPAAMSLVPHGGGGGAMPLQLPPLTTMNYTAWAIKAEAIPAAKGLWSAVAPAEGAAIDARKSKTARRRRWARSRRIC